MPEMEFHGRLEIFERCGAIHKVVFWLLSGCFRSIRAMKCLLYESFMYFDHFWSILVLRSGFAFEVFTKSNGICYLKRGSLGVPLELCRKYC